MAIDGILQDLRCLSPDLVAIPGSFAPNGSSAISASSNYGRGWSVAYTSTGLYSVTFTTKYQQFVTASLAVQLATGADSYLQLGTWTAATKVLQIRNWDVSSAAVADIAANANNRINFVAYFFASTAKPQRGA